MAFSLPFRNRVFFSRRWRGMKIVWALFAIELAFTVPALALFAIAQPDLYRTRLWQDGFDNKFNSNPNARVYAATNRTPYTTPVIWSQFITDFNVVISVLSMFILLVKGVMFILHVFYPLLGLFSHGLLVALWAYSTYAQTHPDNSDPRFPKLSAPWYIVKGCSAAHNPSNIPYCKQATAALGVTVVMLFLFISNTILAIISLVPSTAERRARRTILEEATDTQKSQMRFDAPPMSSKQRSWVAQQRKSGGGVGSGAGYRDDEEGVELKTPKSGGGMMSGALRSPMTPRTFALNKLGGGGGGDGRGGDLPLRQR